MFYFKKNSNRCAKSCSAKSIDVNMLTTVKPTLKPWAYITSKGVLGGLINGRGGGLVSGWAYKRNKKSLGTTR